jgi:hypothetical protein
MADRDVGRGTKMTDPLRKTLAALISCAVLGGQVWALFPVGRGSREYYWPFLDYPMYSAVHYATDFVPMFQLRVVACGQTSGEVPVSHADLGLTPQRFTGFLSELTEHHADGTPATRARAAAFLGNVVGGRLQGHYCRAEVWIKRHANGGDMARNLDSNWQRGYSWALLTPESPR